MEGNLSQTPPRTTRLEYSHKYIKIHHLHDPQLVQLELLGRDHQILLEDVFQGTRRLVVRHARDDVETAVERLAVELRPGLRLNPSEQTLGPLDTSWVSDTRFLYGCGRAGVDALGQRRAHFADGHHL